MKKRISYNIRLLIVLFCAFIVLLPVIFIIINSFMSSGEAIARYSSSVTPYNMLGVIDYRMRMHYVELTLLPDVISFSAYDRILLRDPTHLRFLWNSIILVVPIVLGQLVIAPLAAYGFERTKSKHKDKLYFLYVITLLLPMQALLVPHFIIANFFGFNYLAIILPAVFGAFGVFLVRQQMRDFEVELIEAAKVDGASEFKAFYRIVIPCLRPTMTALAVLAFAEAWNIVDQAVVFIRDSYQMPLSTHLSVAVTGDIGVIFALSTIFMLPALIIFIYGQDSLSEGIGFTRVMK